MSSRQIKSLFSKLSVYLPLFLLGQVLFPSCSSSDNPSENLPNILFITTDDQHYESFGFLEGKAITPRIDRMSAQGIYFSKTYVAASVCTQSRYTA